MDIVKARKMYVYKFFEPPRLAPNPEGFTGRHWTLPSGDNSLRIPRAAARVTINKTLMQNVPTLLAVLVAIMMCRYSTERITQWRRFMAFTKATKRHHRVSTRSDSINQTCNTGCFFYYLIVKKGSS